MVLDELLKIEQQLYKNNPDATVSDDYSMLEKHA